MSPIQSSKRDPTTPSHSLARGQKAVYCNAFYYYFQLTRMWTLSDNPNPNPSPSPLTLALTLTLLLLLPTHSDVDPVRAMIFTACLRFFDIGDSTFCRAGKGLATARLKQYWYSAMK